MAPALTTTTELVADEDTSKSKIATKVLTPDGPFTSRILHRTPVIPNVATHAKGINYYTADGKRIIDAVGGASVVCIGNGNEEVVQAMHEQTSKMAFVYGYQLSNEPAEELAAHLVDSSDGAFELCGFVSGGSEAVEAAIKLGRQYFHEIGQPKRKNYIGRYLSFHGNTLATLAVGNHAARRLPYEDILDHNNFHHVSPAYAKRFQKAAESEEEYVERLRKELEDKFEELGPDTVVGFVAETVVGASTCVTTPPKGYFKAMKSVCDKYGALLILDEVMSGMGRVGTMHAWEKYGDGARPDIQTVAKGLGGGYASIGAVLMNKRVADGIRQGSGLSKHSHTYQCHPVACAASLAVQRIIARDNLVARSAENGEYLSALLHTHLRSPNVPFAKYIYDIRGAGSFWGIEFDFSSSSEGAQDGGDAFKGKRFAMLLQTRCLENGLIVLGFSGTASVDGTKGEAAIISPAYTVTHAEMDEIVEIFARSIEEVLKEHGLI